MKYHIYLTIAVSLIDPIYDCRLDMGKAGIFLSHQREIQIRPEIINFLCRKPTPYQFVSFFIFIGLITW
jgi:hypothetical protein